ncbi:hypothetical protein QFZ22_001519 [Streptomyces canus]|uniref:Uncharacterized protein n=1 Tax=Streptomyces canus TaxID=58343 RepID=A0AAW8F6U3_9ACTN|nr:hypothetical protein [Streptomyces canus]MDQ0905534.1 hypothetical protein [Streptomyces canus]
MIRPTLPVLVPAVVVPTGVAAGQLLDGRVRSQGLARALELPLAPARLAGAVAACASPAALTALVVHLASPAPPKGVPAQRRTAEPAHEAADAPPAP